MVNTAKRERNIYSVLFVLVLVAGIAMRLWQHFGVDRPLWEDEAHLALNFIDSGYLEMFMPLKHFQSAPILFLLFTETFTVLFGFSEVVLRLFPFIVSLSALPVFYFFVRDMSGSRLTALIAFILLSCNAYIIQYSSELKPYIVELSVFIWLGYLLFSTHGYVAQRRERLLKICGIIAMFMANTAFVPLGCIVLYRIYVLRISRVQESEQYNVWKKNNKRLFITWGIAFVANIILNIIINPYADNMREEWASRFIPMNVFSSGYSDFMSARLDELFFSSMFHFQQYTGAAYILTALLLAGLVCMLWFRRVDWLLFSVVPVCMHFALSWLQLYPFFLRFLLYLMPSIIIWLSISVYYIVKLCQKVTPILSAIPIALFLLATINLKVFPYEYKNIIPCLDCVNNKPHDMQLFTTTTKTLYEYYYKTGYAKNATRREVKWFITPQQYYDSVRMQQDNYMLIHSRYNYDGYEPIYRSLDSNGLILEKFEYSDYRVLLVKPKTQ